jgi:hypothetical protein
VTETKLARILRRHRRKMRKRTRALQTRIAGAIEALRSDGSRLWAGWEASIYGVTIPLSSRAWRMLRRRGAA